MNQNRSLKLLYFSPPKIPRHNPHTELPTNRTDCDTKSIEQVPHLAQALYLPTCATVSAINLYILSILSAYMGTKP